MSTRFVAALVFSLSVALLGCPGEDTSADAGTRDAGFDGGVDAGVPDAGQPDAGDLDGGVLPELAILKVLPPRAPTTGNVQVLLQGSGFVAGVAETATGAKQKTTLTVGSNPVIDFQIIDDQTLDMRVPPGQAGLTNITLKNDRGELVCKGCFTYFDEVFLTSVTPAEGPLAGGNEVTLKGGGFTPELQILFGQVSAAEFIFDSPNQIRVKVPRGTALDAVDVTAFSKNGVGVLRRAYRYQEDLRISAIAPLTGPLAGGTNITLTGKGFTGATGVTIGGVPATNVTVVSDTQLTATTPAVTAAGAFPVTVTTPRESWTVRDGFSYVSGAGFAVYGVFPHVGSQAGGNTVTLTGEGLDSGGLVVTIGGVAATVVAANESTARVTVPARTGGRKVDVTATAGAQTSTRPGGYTYRLELGSISPNRGPQLGGTVASIVGVALPADAEVFLGSSKAQVQMVGGETSIALTTPKGQGGRGTDVLVREAGDPENEAVLPGAFTFDEAISVGRVQPDRGAISGGTLVTVLGAGFGEGTLVSFAGQVAKDIKVIDAHTLTCRIPRGDTGAVDVGVRRLTESDTLEGGFSYYDPRSISGGLSGGPLTGTLNISVMDSTQGFFGLPVQQATVVLGLDPFTPFQGLTDGRGQLTFSDPALVKAQTVTVFKEGYESVTVTSVNATNLSVFVARTGGGEGSPGSPPPGRAAVDHLGTGQRLQGAASARAERATAGARVRGPDASVRRHALRRAPGGSARLGEVAAHARGWRVPRPDHRRRARGVRGDGRVQRRGELVRAVPHGREARRHRLIRQPRDEPGHRARHASGHDGPGDGGPAPRVGGRAGTQRALRVARPRGRGTHPQSPQLGHRNLFPLLDLGGRGELPVPELPQPRRVELRVHEPVAGPHHRGVQHVLPAAAR